LFVDIWSIGKRLRTWYIELMAIEITPELENLVQGIFAGGGFTSETEIISTALHLLQKREQLRADLKQGCDELDRGERLDAEQVFAELRQRAAELNGRKG
jgi:hypothetical protein